MDDMRKIKKILTAFMLINFVFAVFVLPAKAQENSENVSITEMNQVMTIQVDCDARELPNLEAAVVNSYAEGASVWVIGETQDGWYKTSYQGLEGYIPKECVTGLQIEVEDEGTVKLEDTELDEELAAVEAESKMLVEEVERQRSEEKRSRVWIVVIVVLVIGIFVTGIISVTKKSKGNEPKTTKRENREKEENKTEDAVLREKDDFDIIDLDSGEE